MSLLKCANEIILMIANHLEIDEILRLMLANRRLHNLLEPLFNKRLNSDDSLSLAAFIFWAAGKNEPKIRWALENITSITVYRAKKLTYVRHTGPDYPHMSPDPSYCSYPSSKKEEIVARILAEGANIYIEDQKISHNLSLRALRWAIRVGRANLAIYLIDHGARRCGPGLCDAITYNMEPVVRQLLERGMSRNPQDFPKGPPLSYAITHNASLSIVRLLLDNKVYFAMGEVPLHMLLESKGTYEFVKLFLEYGASVHNLNLSSQTPLFRAAEKSCLETIKLLVEKGSDVGHRDKSQRSVLHMALRKDLVSVREVVPFFLEKGASLEAKDKDGNTVLHETAKKKDKLEHVRFLLDQGADIDARNNKGETPLSLARASQNLQAVALLEIYGDPTAMTMTSCDEEGEYV